MGDTTSFASVSFQRDDSQHVVKLVFAGEFKGNIDSLVGTAIVHNNDFVSSGLPVLRVASSMALVGLTSSTLSTASPPDVLVEPCNSFLECRENAVLLVVRREDDAQPHLGGLNGSDARCRGSVVLGGLGGLALCEPTVVPARELTWGRGLARGGLAGDVFLLRGEHGSRLGRNDVEEDEELLMLGSPPRCRPLVGRRRICKGETYQRLRNQCNYSDASELNVHRDRVDLLHQERELGLEDVQYRHGFGMRAASGAAWL